MLRTRIKICGITRQRDAAAAIAAGADALGLIFYRGSKRAVNIDQALEIVAGLPPMVTLVGLFVDENENEVRRVCEQLPLRLLQFHGREPASYCDGFGLPWMKAISVAPDTAVAERAADYPQASAILLDTWHDGAGGGTGVRFNWQQVPAKLPQPLVLAGGLGADNVAEAIASVRPFAVDICSSVESAPGKKDVAELARFIQAVRSADIQIRGTKV